MLIMAQKTEGKGFGMGIKEQVYKIEQNISDLNLLSRSKLKKRGRKKMASKRPARLLLVFCSHIIGQFSRKKSYLLGVL